MELIDRDRFDAVALRLDSLTALCGDSETEARHVAPLLQQLHDELRSAIEQAERGRKGGPKGTVPIRGTE